VNITFEQWMTVFSSVGVPLILGVLALIWRDSAAQKRAIAAKWIGIAYQVTTEVSKSTKTPVDDKIAYALGVLAKGLATEGLEVDPKILEQAKLTWTATSGAEKQAVEIAAKVKQAVSDPSQPLAQP